VSYFKLLRVETFSEEVNDNPVLNLKLETGYIDSQGKQPCKKFLSEQHIWSAVNQVSYFKLLRVETFSEEVNDNPVLNLKLGTDI
jgi:hypothetical protein